MVTLKLSVAERILLVSTVDHYAKSGHFTLSELSKFIKLSDRINFTPEERSMYGFRNHVDASGRAQVVWHSRKDGNPEGEVLPEETEIEVSDEQKEMLYSVVKETDAKKDFFSPDNFKIVASFAGKLGYNVE